MRPEPAPGLVDLNTQSWCASRAATTLAKPSYCCGRIQQRGLIGLARSAKCTVRQLKREQKKNIKMSMRANRFVVTSFYASLAFLLLYQYYPTNRSVDIVRQVNMRWSHHLLGKWRASIIVRQKASFLQRVFRIPGIRDTCGRARHRFLTQLASQAMRAQHFLNFAHWHAEDLHWTKKTNSALLIRNKWPWKLRS